MIRFKAAKWDERMLAERISRIVEGDTGFQSLVFSLQLSAATDHDVKVDWYTADFTAIAGADYLSGSGTIVFKPGEVEKTFSVHIIGDQSVEAREKFHVYLRNAVGADIGDGHATGSITNDDR